MTRILVLGGGISGTYATKRFVDSGFDVTMITKPVTTTPVTPFMIMHAIPRTRLLLKTFGINGVGTHKLKIAYAYKGKIYKHVNEVMVSEYTKKSYGKASKGSMFLYDLGLNIFDIPFEQILSESEICVKDNTVHTDVISIDVFHRIVRTTSGNSYQWDILVNTIALPNWVELVGFDYLTYDFNYRSVYVGSEDKVDLGGNDLVLVMDESNPVTRYMSNFSHTRTFSETFIKPEVTVAFYKYGKIIPSSKLNKTKNEMFKNLEKYDVHMVGRFSRWENHYDTEQSILDVESILRNLV
jgi:hypothetical protein